MKICFLLSFSLAATTLFGYAGPSTQNAASEREMQASLAGSWAPEGADDTYRIESEAVRALAQFRSMASPA